MRRRYLLRFAVTCLVAALTITTADLAIPQLMRIGVAMLIVFIVPGYAVVCAVLPAWQLSSAERLLASLGISLVVATTVAVILGATPVGLSRGSFSVALGASTIALSVIAWVRSFMWFRWRPGPFRRLSRDGHSKGVPS